MSPEINLGAQSDEPQNGNIPVASEEGVVKVDRFLNSPPRQPKKEIADMLESRGILVPRRFENLADALEAIKNGKEIVVRSEHPQEYASAAGLLDSYVITADQIARGEAFCAANGAEIDWDNVYNQSGHGDEEDRALDRILGSLRTTDQATFEDNLKKLSLPRIARYCELLGIDKDEFLQGISYSYWERVGGMNRSIVADSAIFGRYHIFTTSAEEENYFHNYYIVDNGEMVFSGPCSMTDELEKELDATIAFYEQIRSAEGFNPSHCPLVEFQSHEGKNYFLQYHRTRDMEPCLWQLDREPEEGEFEAEFVRGATSPEGMELNIAMYYPDGKYPIYDEDGSFDFHYDRVFSEIMSRFRKANFDNKPLWKIAMCCADTHLPKSKLFNPQISISIDDSNMPPGLPSKLRRQTNESGEPATVKVRVVSDGRKAYMKFLKLSA